MCVRKRDNVFLCVSGLCAVQNSSKRSYGSVTSPVDLAKMGAEGYLPPSPRPHAHSLSKSTSNQFFYSHLF